MATSMIARIIKHLKTPITPEASYFKFIWPLIAIISIPHELCHWVTARVLGIRYKLTLMEVIPEDDNEEEAWKLILIGLAPSLIGFLVYIYLLYIGLFVWETKTIVKLSLIAWAWQSGCSSDFREVIEIFKEVKTILNDRRNK